MVVSLMVVSLMVVSLMMVSLVVVSLIVGNAPLKVLLVEAPVLEISVVGKAVMLEVLEA